MEERSVARGMKGRRMERRGVEKGVVEGEGVSGTQTHLLREGCQRL